jgi:hypothetical protein
MSFTRGWFKPHLYMWRGKWVCFFHGYHAVGDTMQEALQLARWF